MFVYQRLAGTTDVSVVIRIIDATDGTPETGVVFNTSGIDIQYRREGAASTAITEATLAALTTAHSDGGFLHIGNGYYRLDLPDAACAAGATGVLVHGTVTGMIVIGCYLQLVAYDPFDAVRLGLTALPNAAADAAGGLPISDAGAVDVDAVAAAVTNLLARLAPSANAEPGGVPAHSAAVNVKLGFLLAQALNITTLNRSTGAYALRNAADDADLATGTHADDGTTTTKGALS